MIRTSDSNLLTTKVLRGVKQGVRRAQNMIHTLSLDNFDNNINSLVKALKGNRKLLAFYGESESSILTDILIVLKKSQNSEFNSYISHFQDKYYYSTNIDLDDLMCKIIVKYDSVVKDGQWDTEPKKYVYILALTIQIQ